MKLAKLYLKSFGPFTGKWLNFEQARSDLHLIYGPNEAGKSSLLRAVGALLFGIPERTSDNFLHDNTALRIGGVLMRRPSKTVFCRNSWGCSMRHSSAICLAWTMTGWSRGVRIS